MMSFESWREARRILINYPLLILDDLGYVNVDINKRYKPLEFAGLIKARHRMQNMTLITSNKNLSELADYLDPSVSSRLQEGIMIHMDGKDYRGEIK